MIGTSGSRIIRTRNTAPDEHDHAVEPWDERRYARVVVRASSESRRALFS